jgi:hypothetical protein
MTTPSCLPRTFECFAFQDLDADFAPIVRAENGGAGNNGQVIGTVCIR